jgi:hypothetical protein
MSVTFAGFRERRNDGSCLDLRADCEPRLASYIGGTRLTATVPPALSSHGPWLSGGISASCVEADRGAGIDRSIAFPTAHGARGCSSSKRFPNGSAV